MKLVLDAGALIAIDRNDRRVAGLIELARRAGAELVSTTPVVTQAWRDGARQARLAKALPMIEIEVVELADAKRAGELLASAGRSDAVDALVAMLAGPADQILTSDPNDLRSLCDARGIHPTIVEV